MKLNLGARHNAYERSKFGPQLRKRRGKYFICETCKKEFYVSPARIRQVKKQGNQIRFCSMICYDKHGENNPFWGKKHKLESTQQMMQHPNHHTFQKGIHNPNYQRYSRETFIGRSKIWWFGYLMETLGKCEKCGFNDSRILLLHHKDRNPQNNCKENLMLLCPNCHILTHFIEKTGSYYNATEETRGRKIRNKLHEISTLEFGVG